jgi:cyclopropane fatty-acyl-phospholipid synthase-like methyltransferase
LATRLAEVPFTKEKTMQNFVAKHDFNRAATHKTAKDYSRTQKHNDNSLDDYWDEYLELIEQEEAYDS